MININGVYRRRNSKITVLLLIFFTNVVFCTNKFSLKDSLLVPRTGWRGKNTILSLGIGVPNTDVFIYKAASKMQNSYVLSHTYARPALHAKLEFYAGKHFGIGASANYSILQLSYTAKGSPLLYSASYHVFTFEARFNYHILYRKRLDLYIGAGAGLRFVESYYQDFLIGPGYLKSGPFAFESSIGMRYLFKGRIGLYAEAGVGRSLLQAGLSINLKRRGM